jgi:uncharacterized damage-inducible protein DinB
MQYYGAKELARSFRTVRRNTLAVANDIPEAQYGFRATPESRSVAEVLAHLAVITRASHETHAVRRITTYVGIDFPAIMRQRQEEERTLTTKAAIVEALETSGEAWAGYLDTVTEEDLAQVIPFSPPAEPREKSRFEMLLSLKEHEMHHRAQLMVVERLLGIVPHLTRERQARFAQASSARS